MNKDDMIRANAAENIELSLPMNAAYVSAARLTASSIANRLGFDIDEIEDIKAAVSEASTYIIKKASDSKTSVFKLAFLMQNGMLEIRFNTDIKISISELEEEMSLLMVKALMDNLELSKLDNINMEMKMIKIHQKTTFD